MASVERTAYPRFGRFVSDRELRETFTPSGEEIAWARERTRSQPHLLALLVLLKSAARLGHFPDLYEVPIAVVDHIRACAECKPDVEAVHDSERTLRHHKGLVRTRLGIVADPERARAVAEASLRAAAATKDHPADLINVALEELVRARLELPAYSTLDELASRVRTEVNTTVYMQMAARMDAADAAALDGLLDVDPVSRRSGFDRCKTVAPAVTVTRFREHVAHLSWLDSLADTAAWVAGVPPTKIAHFAGEARLTDAADLRKYGTDKRLAVMASLLHTARVRARDEIVTMFCKRMASIHKRARERLAELREAHRGESERLLDGFGEVLAGVREALGASDAELAEGVADPPEEVFARAGRLVLEPPPPVVAGRLDLATIH